MNAIRGLAAFLVVAAVSLFGQATDGNIVGTVLDPSAGAVTGAKVELENVDTGVRRATETDSIGLYRFFNVPIGNYRVRVNAPGFAAGSLENVTVSLNRTTTANLTLELGRVATEVQVVEASSLIDTTTATIGTAFGAKQAVELPISNLPLGVMNLSLLGAGVGSSGGVGLGEGPSVGGQRPRQNNFTIEGVDNNRKDVTGANLRVPNEAVAEFSMLQNQFAAEFGHSTGGQFNTVLKSGTNEVHGSLYEYFQNRNLNAVDETFARQGIREHPRLDDNRFGGSVGGPIVRNKLFYFGNFQYNPVGLATTPSSATLTPTAEGYRLLDGLSGISQTNLSVLKEYAPASGTASTTTQVSGVDIPIGTLPINFPTYQNSYDWVGSVDYNISDRDQLRGRYIESRFSGIDPDVSPNLPAFKNPREITQRLISVSEFHNFSPTLFNELRVAYARYEDDIPAGSFQFPGLDVFPNIEIQQDLNIQIGPYINAPQSGIQNTYQLVNNVSWLKGRHSFKFGIDGRKYIAPTNFIQRVRGDYNYSNLERYLLDLSPDVLGERNTGGVPYSGNQIDFYWFAQDEIKVRSNLTLNLGIRHEYKGIPEGDKLQTLNAISNVPGLLVFDEPRPQKKNFAPRIGLAYSPGQSGLTVLRAGFGIGYDTSFDNFGTLSKPVQLENTFSLDASATTQNFLATGGIRPDQRPEELDQETARNFTSTYIQDQKLPYSIQWNAGVQRVFAQDYTLEVRYLGTRGVNLFTQDRINVRARAVPGRTLPTFLQRPSQAELDALPLTLNDLQAESNILPEYRNAGFLSPITVFVSRGNSIYHGFATELTRRFTNGLLFKGAYTWSHLIDDSTADLFSTQVTPRRPQDFQNWDAERASSMLDRRHRFTMSWVYDAPWFRGDSSWVKKNLLGNWLFNGVYTLESDQYGTVQSGLDSNLNGDSAGDRIMINPAGASGTGSDVEALRNSDGRVVGYVALDPNARYIKAGAGVHPNGGRNLLPIAGINNLDLSVGKRFSITERTAVEFRGSFVNALNHPQYVPGSLNTVQAIDSSQTRNHLIPGNELFNDPSQVYSSNSRMIFLVARFTF